MLTLFEVPEPEEPDKTEKKRRGRKEDATKTEQRKKSTVVEESRITEVYDYWIEVMRPGRKKVAKLDEERRRQIGAAVYDYGVEGCKQAIDGCAASDWHMGRNPARKRYDGIGLIFRSQQKIEFFMGLSPDAEDET